nr:MAG TPA: hypothetical protein [Caudoviricetes sp.]
MWLLFYILGTGERPDSDPESLPLILCVFSIVGVFVTLALLQKPKG